MARLLFLAMLRSSLPTALIGLMALLPVGAAGHAQTCEFLTPVGGDGASNTVTKTIGPPKVTPIGLIAGKTNWNTDFFVTKPYRSYKFFFTANSSVSATYPIQGFMKFTDGSSLQVINESFTPQVGTGRMFGPFQAVPGKTVSQLNFKIGTASDLAATGFTYRISTQGCF